LDFLFASNSSNDDAADGFPAVLVSNATGEEIDTRFLDEPGLILAAPEIASTANASLEKAEDLARGLNESSHALSDGSDMNAVEGMSSVAANGNPTFLAETSATHPTTSQLTVSLEQKVAANVTEIDTRTEPSNKENDTQQLSPAFFHGFQNVNGADGTWKVSAAATTRDIQLPEGGVIDFETSELVAEVLEEEQQNFNNASEVGQGGDAETSDTSQVRGNEFDACR
jgi:hypothetical protein